MAKKTGGPKGPKREKGEGEDDGRRRAAAKRADDLVGRFPLTNLAEAVALTGINRRKHLARFVEGAGLATYGPTRDLMLRLYGGHGARDGAVGPLIEDLPPDPWSELASSLSLKCRAGTLEDNLEVSKLIFDNVRAEHAASSFEPMVMNFGTSRIILPISMYCTRGEQVLFHFAHLRRAPLTPAQEDVIATLIHRGCAIDPFEDADIEIVHFPAMDLRAMRGRRTFAIKHISSSRFLAKDDLDAEITDVYTILREIAAGR